VTKILLDTNILIDYSKDRETVLDELLFEKEVELYINPVVVAEYLADKNLINKQKKTQAFDFLDQFKIININKRIGVETGEIMRNDPTLNWKDAMIAATCLVNDCKLATRNRKHFGKIKGLKFATA